MNLHREDLDVFDTTESNISSLPYDFFYSNEYDYITLPEVQVLFTLSDSSVSYTFAGLRKKTQLHQYKVSKSLRRLQERGLIAKENDGTYSLTSEGEKFSLRLTEELMKRGSIFTPEYQAMSKQQLELVISDLNQLDHQFLKMKLYGRWFSDFRFLYAKEDEETLVLCWQDVDKMQICLVLNSENNLSIQYDSSPKQQIKIEQFISWLSKELLCDIKIKNNVSSYGDEEIYN